MASAPILVRSRAENMMVACCAAVVIVAMLAPIVVVAVISLTSSNVLQFPPPSWSLRWYAEIVELVSGEADGGVLRRSLITSLQIATLTASIAVASGVPAAYALSRYQFPGKGLVELLLSLPVVFPTIVLGVSLLVAMTSMAMELGIWQIVVAHTIITLPFVVRNCYAAVHGVSPALEEAARTLGAPPSRTFAEIVFPLMRPGVIAGFLLVFIISMNEFTLSYFLYSVDASPISIWLFQQSNTSLDPKIFAVSTLLISMNVVIILSVERLFGTKSMRF